MDAASAPEEMGRVLAEADLLYGEVAVEAALDRMAESLTARLRDSNPLVLAVMLGGLVPTGKLLSRMDFPLQLDYLHATRYRGDTRGRDLRWVARPVHALEDRVVLVVDDILDEGVTLTEILRYCEASGAREVYSAVLVHKRHTRKSGIERADFTGLSVEDRYVFGYGMDYKGYLRNARGIYAVKGL